MPIKEADYYSDRHRASVEMSHAALEPSVRRIHLELARRYADLAGEPRDGVEPIRATLNDFKDFS